MSLKEQIARLAMETEGVNLDTARPAVSMTLPTNVPTLKDPERFGFLGKFNSENFDVELGISSLRFFPARSEKQRAAGIIGKVSMRTPYFAVNGITIFAKKLDAPMLVDDQTLNYYIFAQNPSYQSNNNWYSDTKITREAAQKICAFVFPMVDQTLAGPTPNLRSVETKDIWYLKEQDEDTADAVQVNGTISTYGFRKATSPAQQVHRIFGKCFLNTPAASINGCTVFYKELAEPIEGRNYSFSVVNPSHKDRDGNQVSDTILFPSAKKVLLQHVDSLTISG